MEGVLIIAHGSRAKETEQTLSSICSQVKQMLPERTIEIAFMEFGERNIVSGLDGLIKKGIKTIKVIPYFLFEGIHIKEDIPMELEAYMKKNPDIKITMGKTLGDDARLSEIVRDRIEE